MFILELFVIGLPSLILTLQENNDPICIMNCFIVLYFTYRWWEEKTYFNASMIGLFTGLAMMAKLSGALAIIPALVAFIYTIIKAHIDHDTVKNYYFQGSIIAAIAAPIGLWFQIYAKVRFNQPFGFVFSNLTDELYVGNYNFFLLDNNFIIIANDSINICIHIILIIENRRLCFIFSHNCIHD